MHYCLEHIKHAAITDGFLWDLGHCNQLCKIFKHSAQTQSNWHWDPVYCIIKCFYSYFKVGRGHLVFLHIYLMFNIQFLSCASQASAELQHQFSVLSSCFMQGFYITGISSQNAQWLTHLMGLFAFRVEEIVYGNSLPSLTLGPLNFTLESLFNDSLRNIENSPLLDTKMSCDELRSILTQATICHPNFHALTGHNAHPESSCWYFIDFSKGYELLVRHYIRHPITPIVPLQRGWLRYLKNSPHEPSLISDVEGTISLIDYEDELHEIVLWLQVCQPLLDSFFTSINLVVARVFQILGRLKPTE